MVASKGGTGDDVGTLRSDCESWLWVCGGILVDWCPEEQVDDGVAARKSGLGESEPLDVAEGGGVGAVAFTCFFRFEFEVIELG